jgi:hypothetical protein
MCRCEELIELTRQRADQLRDWVKGKEAGDVCAGSVKMRDYTGQSTRKAKPMRRTRSEDLLAGVEEGLVPSEPGRSRTVDDRAETRGTRMNFLRSLRT